VAETLAVLERLDPLWDELFPVKQARIVRLLVEWVEISTIGADVRLRVRGLASLVHDVGGIGTESRSAASQPRPASWSGFR
jgi:site-specific DNA recombinase